MVSSMNECGLKNDALMDTFYDVIMEHYRAEREYAILVFHDRYDIPAKGSDKERQWESEEVFEYMICNSQGYHDGNHIDGFKRERTGQLNPASYIGICIWRWKGKELQVHD